MSESFLDNPIKAMFVLALLYLPLGFFLWFFASSLLMFPAGRLAEWLLTSAFPEVFEGLVQLNFQFEIQTAIILSRPVDGREVALDLFVNPMVYAWGMALLFGLVMATPLAVTQRMVQLLISFAVITGVTVWGVFWETLTDLAFRSGPEAGEVAAGLGVPMDLIALFYQLGFLMLPAVVPVALWILMNRAFVEQHVLRRSH